MQVEPTPFALSSNVKWAENWETTPIRSVKIEKCNLKKSCYFCKCDINFFVSEFCNKTCYLDQFSFKLLEMKHYWCPVQTKVLNCHLVRWYCYISKMLNCRITLLLYRSLSLLVRSLLIPKLQLKKVLSCSLS